MQSPGVSWIPSWPSALRMVVVFSRTAAVVAVRRAGAIHVFNSLNYFFTINEMIIPGSSYWNIGMGRQPGEVNSDAEGVQTMKNLGKNMAACSINPKPFELLNHFTLPFNKSNYL